MTKTSDSRDLFPVVEEVDELISDAFRIADVGGIAEDPKRRHRLFAVLLRGFGEYTPGFDISQVRSELKREIGEERWNEIEKHAARLGELIPMVVKPTYTTTSYWSPIDERRHTVIHKPLTQGEDRRHTLAYAYAFFTLTFTGAPNELYSVIQYISVRARHKRGPRVCFKEDPPAEQPLGWWHIPEHIHKPILEETGITEAIQHVLLKDGQRTEEELEHALNLTLVNTKENEWKDDIDSFAAEIIKTFSHRHARLTGKTRDAVENTQLYLSKLFGGNKLTPEQALFMLVTHLIYKEACPTDYIHTFPTRVAQTCCVITVGTGKVPTQEVLTREPLDPSRHLALSRIASSIFTHPLLLDYAAQEAAARERYAAGAIHRISGPLGALRNRFLEGLKDACESKEKGLGVKVWRILQKDFAKSFETNLDQIKASVDFLRAFVGTTKPATFEIVSVLRELVEAQKKIYKRLTITFNSEIPGAYVWGWQSELEFCIEEIVYNSSRILAYAKCETPTVSVKVRLIEKKEENGIQRSRVYEVIQFPAVEVVINDNGPGIPASDKEKIFESGFKGKDSGSTGKGLYLVRYFVHEHFRGLVYEDGIPGGGATFRIYLPGRRAKNEDPGN